MTNKIVQKYLFFHKIEPSDITEQTAKEAHLINMTHSNLASFNISLNCT